jgi:hypothetical protein
METFRLWRQLAVRRRLDLEAAIAGPMSSAWIVMADPRFSLDEPAAVNRRLHMNAFGQTPVAFDHRVGGVDAVDDDRHASAAWNDERNAVIGRRR